MEENNTCELGWRFNKNYWNSGYDTEVVENIVNYIFNETYIYCIEANRVHIDNIASRRIYENLRFILNDNEDDKNKIKTLIRVIIDDCSFLLLKNL